MYYKVETSGSYRGLNILPKSKKGEEKRLDILERLRSIVFYMIDNHSKVMQTRFDLRYPKIENFEYLNRDIYPFINEFTRSLNRMNCSGHYVDAKYLWVREQKTSYRPHYHVVVFCNGNAIQSPYKIFEKAEYYWEKTIGYRDRRLVNYCLENNGIKHENGIMINRNKYNFEFQLNKAFKAASYLAKLESKDTRDKYSCVYGSSHIPLKYSYKKKLILSNGTVLNTEEEY